MDHTNSRRYFLKTAGSLLGAAFLGLWGTMIHTQRKSKKKELIRISLDSNGTVLFHEDCIVINKDQPVVLSSYCTHLGCRIQTFENGQLVCPCHGSTFDLEGNPLKGPAITQLKKLDFTLNKETQTITIKI